MIIYEYFCDGCQANFDSLEEVSDQHETSDCPTCGRLSRRVYSAPYSSVDNTETHFDPGLGCMVSNKHDIREAQHRYHGETGSRLIELGNETQWKAKRRHQPLPTPAELGIV